MKSLILHHVLPKLQTRRLAEEQIDGFVIQIIYENID